MRIRHLLRSKLIRLPPAPAAQAIPLLSKSIPRMPISLGGSWYVEALTTDMERGARRLVDEIESQGGAARAIERGFFQDAIARSAYEQQRAVESGERVVVGVNEYLVEEPAPSVPAPDYTALAAGQRARLVQLRERREAGAVQRALEALDAAARDAAAPLMEPILEAVRARATVAEISDVLRGVWGEYKSP